ncbi:hypothetical protein [Niabella drilacis]|uniref:Poly(3-hydroxybutyrate) depolymerase n=1 Tax=Niabella drilacis (strain DSM 25811 / CCM 8410 / CCUG 62505 / LMG 26954 / E90) TaxID=1285928 RepID=A0A1G6QD03_NIADE|nr:hypothetical protein [Niabella drilacis]SDC89555.1 Poly(3-hydroxybutyrate) depolymerase [Niabella drilacis]
MKKQFLPILCVILALLMLIVAVLSCSKKQKEDDALLPGNIERSTQTTNGITYKVYVQKDRSTYKGILVMGSGNDEHNPTQGSLEGGPENALCQKAAENGYIAAIVQYHKGPGTADWNKSAEMMGQDYDHSIRALADKYGVDKSRSVVGGYSYATTILYTTIAYYSSLDYCKGLLGACGGTGADAISKFKIPVFAINCAGNNEGDNITGFYGKPLYDRIPNNSPVKAKSAGITDGTCNTHCAKAWTEELYAKLSQWLP